MRLLKYLFLILILASASCKKADHKLVEDGHCGCDKNMICTEEFRSLVLNVKDKQGKPVVLDAIFTYKESTQEKIIVDDLSFQEPPYQGSYSIWNDLQLKTSSKHGETIRVVGMIKTKEIFSQPFKVGHDCCHVVKLEGPDTIEIDVNL